MKYILFLPLSVFCLCLLAAQPSLAAEKQQVDPGEAAYLLFSEISFMQGQADIDLFLNKLGELDSLPETYTGLYWKMNSVNTLADALEIAGKTPEATALRSKYADLGTALAVAGKAKKLADEGRPDEALEELLKLEATGHKYWPAIMYSKVLPSITYEYYKAGKSEKAVSLYEIFEQEPYVNMNEDINQNRLDALDGMIRLAPNQSQPNFVEVIKLYKRLEVCKAQGACPDSAVAEITASLIEVMLRAGRFDDADMLYRKILALKDDPMAGEKTETTSSDYDAKCRVRMFQQLAAQNLIQAYDNEENAGKMRSVYDQAYAVLSTDPLGQGYLVKIAKDLIIKTAKTAKAFNDIFQTLTLPENILLPEDDDCAYFVDDQSFFTEQYNARVLYLRMYQQVFREALDEKDLKLAESIYKQGSAWKTDKIISVVITKMKAQLDQSARQGLVHK